MVLYGRTNRAIMALLGALMIANFARAELVEVKGDNFMADEVKQIAILEGNVDIKKGDYDTLNADKLTIYFDADKNPTKYVATGGNPRFKILMKDKHYFGKADELVYEPATDTYTMTGNAYLKEDETKKELFGSKITTNQAEGTYRVFSDGKKKPVRFIFEVEDKK